LSDSRTGPPLCSERLLAYLSTLPVEKGDNAGLPFQVPVGHQKSIVAGRIGEYPQAKRSARL
jgi:hypothetical protein